MALNLETDTTWMKKAFEEALKAEAIDEVPIGAVIVDASGNILATAFNEKEKDHNPLGHAELLAMKRASEKLSNWRLSDCTLYVTLEPCPMCMAAMVQARIGRLVFGAYDSKGGAISLGYHNYKDLRLNHNFSVTGGVMQRECGEQLSNYFRKKRKRK